MNENRYVVYIRKCILHVHFSVTVFYIEKSVTFFCFIQHDNRLCRSSIENGLIYVYNYFLIKTLFIVV
jgi:hypothetical protein